MIQVYPTVFGCSQCLFVYIHYINLIYLFWLTVIIDFLFIYLFVLIYIFLLHEL